MYMYTCRCGVGWCFIAVFLHPFTLRYVYIYILSYDIYIICCKDMHVHLLL